jgi:hypothetical protein
LRPEALGGLRSCTPVGCSQALSAGAFLRLLSINGFAAGDLVMFQQRGLGIAVAVFLDATIGRCVLVLAKACADPPPPRPAAATALMAATTRDSPAALSAVPEIE